MDIRHLFARNARNAELNVTSPFQVYVGGFETPDELRQRRKEEFSPPKNKDGRHHSCTVTKWNESIEEGFSQFAQQYQYHRKVALPSKLHIECT